MQSPTSEPRRTEPTERTTVSLPVGVVRRLKHQAESSGRSVSSIVREALHAYLAGQPAPRMPSFVGIGRSGRSDISERYEELIAEGFDPRAEK